MGRLEVLSDGSIYLDSVILKQYKVKSWGYI
jgi:hypothetical protein